MPTLTVTVDPEGNTTLKVEGVVGKGCTDLTKPIEDALGVTTSDQKTPEFHRVAGTGSQAKAGAS